MLIAHQDVSKYEASSFWYQVCPLSRKKLSLSANAGHWRARINGQAAPRDTPVKAKQREHQSLEIV